MHHHPPVIVQTFLNHNEATRLASLIASLILPPAGPLTLIALGLLVLAPLPATGYALAALGVFSLYLLSTPVIAFRLLNTLQAQNVVLRQVPADTQAIVVLGGGRNRDAEEYGGDTIECFTLERLRYASRLHEESGLPILASGGGHHNEPVSEASMMKEVLERDFKTKVTWAEGNSRDTFENARNSVGVLAQHGISRVLLVTHRWHMPRALWCFRQVGLDVTPAPTACDSPRLGCVLVPHYRALYMASNALSEFLAIAWYRLRYARKS
jgi:uncharacterized SAM-binding protein YcdF (DUF218 family)